MKSIRQWLEELPEPIRSQALANLENQNWSDGRHRDPGRQTDFFSNALGMAFHWTGSPEGNDYWYDLSYRLDEVDDERKRPTTPLT